MSRATSLTTLGLPLTISFEQQKIMQVVTGCRAFLCSKCYRESAGRCTLKGSVRNHGSHRPEKELLELAEANLYFDDVGIAEYFVISVLLCLPSKSWVKKGIGNSWSSI